MCVSELERGEILRVCVCVRVFAEKISGNERGRMRVGDGERKSVRVCERASVCECV